MSIIVGILCSMTGRYRWAIWTGWVFAIAGSGILFLLDVETTITQWVFINIPVSIGTGMLFPAMTLGIQAASRQEDAGHSVAFYAFTRVFGQALGVAVGGVAFQNEIRRRLSSYALLAPKAEEWSRDATALVSIIKHMEDGVMKTQLKEAYADGLRIIWLIMLVLAAVAGLASLWTQKFSLDQEMKTKQGFKEQQKVKDVEKVEA